MRRPTPAISFLSPPRRAVSTAARLRAIQERAKIRTRRVDALLMLAVAAGVPVALFLGLGSQAAHVMATGRTLLLTALGGGR